MRKFCGRDQKARPSPELSPTEGSQGDARLPEDAAWKELVPWLEQLPVGDTARLRNSRSIEGSRGLRRLTGQKAEPPWGVKFTLFGSGHEETGVGLDWSGALKMRRKKIQLG